MSLIDRLKLKLKVKTFLMYGYNARPPMAIPIYTVLPYCVIITQYGSIYCVYRDCHGLSSIIAIHKDILVFTFSFNLNLSFKDIKVENR